ncbi:MAG: DNA polymerase III subunit gamma/tau [Hyphomicrobiaceae bacterium]
MAKKKSTPPEAPAEKPARAYIVLARKYRPETFTDLIGQDAMVTTLKNAFATGRLAHGYMLTGVRGVGKTTTARILARALNYSKPGLPDRPTVDMDGDGVHCREIMQSRHPDVLEMDAASNTGVDNIRELIESARYKPISARYRVFVVDEVHMLSKGAFNALLKTLEEPPEHVKFIFATTEVRKVPVTVLSRCQRFDLRRVDVPRLVEHLGKIVVAEGADAEDEALRLIARAAGGSVRDGLSLLDQGIAMGAGTVTAAGVRAMLGLADRGRIFDLAEHLFRGTAGAAIGALEGLHRDGAEPAQVLADLAEAVHAATRMKVAGAETDAGSEGLSAEEKRRARALADRLSLAILSRAWQMLLKGLEDAARAPDPLAAAEMVLIRIAHTADLPSPDEVMRALAGGGVPARKAASADSDAPPPPEPPAARAAAVPILPEPGATAPLQLATFADVVALAGTQREAKLKVHLEDHVSPVRFEPGRLEIRLLPGAPAGLANELSEKLTRWTGRRWMVVLVHDEGERPLGEVRRQREAEELAGLKRHPAVAALLEEFPEAEITDVRPLRRSPRDDSVAG